MPTTKSTKTQKRSKKVCNRCGHESALNAQSCKGCGSKKFAPDWVVAKRSVNRQVSVEVTLTNPEYGDVQKRITLSKWWPGGRSTFHLPNSSQWEAIETIIDRDLAPLIGWAKKDELIKSVREKKDVQESSSADLRHLVDQHPNFLSDVVAAIDVGNRSSADLEKVVLVLEELTKALANADQGFSQAFLTVISKLPKQGKRALEDLEGLLANWSLRQVTTVTQQVRSRLETIELFKERILDPRTYEIQGDNSIHRILEGAMWLIDERYWLLQANSTVRKLIGTSMSKKDKARYGSLRPDFVCGLVGEKLIIIEIKRPSHDLTIEDMNQLETYVSLAEDHLTFRGVEGYLIGNKKGADLVKRMKYRSERFKVWTYSDLIDGCEKRYRSYLEG